VGLVVMIIWLNGFIGLYRQNLTCYFFDNVYNKLKDFLFYSSLIRNGVAGIDVKGSGVVPLLCDKMGYFVQNVVVVPTLVCYGAVVNPC